MLAQPAGGYRNMISATFWAHVAQNEALFLLSYCWFSTLYCYCQIWR